MPNDEGGTPGSRSGDTYRLLCALIVRGRLAPGARVAEAELAVRLGVSRTPVREALLRLHRDGFLVPVGSSYRTQLAVAPLTRADAADLYNLMAGLEGLAARGVPASRPAARRALAADLRRLTRDLDRASRARPIDYDALFEAHGAFHARLDAACARGRVRTAIAAVQLLVDRYEYAYAPLVGPPFSETLVEHRAIADAVRDGDADAIEAAVRANWWNSADRLGAVIDRVGDRAGVGRAPLPSQVDPLRALRPE